LAGSTLFLAHYFAELAPYFLGLPLYFSEIPCSPKWRTYSLKLFYILPSLFEYPKKQFTYITCPFFVVTMPGILPAEPEERVKNSTYILKISNDIPPVLRVSKTELPFWVTVGLVRYISALAHEKMPFLKVYLHFFCVHQQSCPLYSA
jgi:hypothetical protein